MRGQNGNGAGPEAARELAALDAALAGDPVEPKLAELAELALVLRAERPRPQPQFAAELDARVRAGFSPRTPESRARTAAGQPRRVRVRRRPRLLPTALAGAASLFIAVTAVVSSGVLSGSDGGNDAGRRPVETAPAPSAGGGAPARAPELGDELTSKSTSPPVPPPVGGAAPRERRRQVERQASLTLAAAGEEIEELADGVIEVTDRYRGFVLRSTVAGGEDARAGATFDLRVPTDRLQPLLRDLSALAHVRSRTQNTEDITARFVSIRGRLHDALAERRALLRQLARADTPNETASIRARLRLARREIERARGARRGLQNRVAFSAVAVSIEADDSLESAKRSWTPGDALRDALGILETSLALALLALAVLLPVSLLVLVGWLAWRESVRRRRQTALDRSAAIEKSGPR